METTNDQRRHNEDNKEDKHDKVKDGITDHATTTELRLLQRVDRRTNLSAARIVSKIEPAESGT